MAASISSARCRAPTPSPRSLASAPCSHPATDVRYLTLANQITILRIMLIPAFVLLTVYGHRGAALAVFFVAGATDAIDGLIARLTSHPTSFGAWLDPMADKLLLVTTFVVLTVPQIELTNHVPLWLPIG